MPEIYQNPPPWEYSELIHLGGTDWLCRYPAISTELEFDSALIALNAAGEDGWIVCGGHRDDGPSYLLGRPKPTRIR